MAEVQWEEMESVLEFELVEVELLELCCAVVFVEVESGGL